MSKVAPSGKYLNLDEVRISYRPKDDSIHITSGDEDLAGSAFHLTLPQGSESEQILRELLLEQGLIRPVTESPLPEKLELELTRFSPSNEIVLGKTETGNLMWDVTRHPHALMVGRTGSGKSTVIRTLFAHCLTHSKQWEFNGIDLKNVELAPYKQFARTVGSIVHTVDDAFQLVNDLVSRMEMRYDQMGKEGVNRYIDLKTPVRAVLLVVDESTMLMGWSDDEYYKTHAQANISKLLRLGRAAGIHLLFSTQNVDNNLFSGEMRNNITTRIAMGRLTASESALLLSTPAATRVQGNVRGRGIFSNFDEEYPFQAAFTSLEALTEWVKEYGEAAEPELHYSLTKR